MKSTIALSLAAAAMAAPAARPGSTSDSNICPGVDNTQATSNNFQNYNIYCNKWIDNDNVIRITDTEIGFQGCLTACDGTIGCGAVEYIATDEAQTKGSCTIFPETALKDGASNSWTVAVPVSVSNPPSSTTSSATSSASTAAPTSFGGLSIRSGSDIQYASINANGGSFWLGKNTTTYCPSETVPSCPADDVPQYTTFTASNTTGTLSLDVSVPGGQQIYVSGTDGALKFTQPHSAYMGEGALQDGFGIHDTHLQFQADDWLACPVEGQSNGVYGVYAASKHTEANSDCLGFAFLIQGLGEGQQSVWEYV